MLNTTVLEEDTLKGTAGWDEIAVQNRISDQDS